MQSKAKRFGALKEGVKSVETHTEEPNYKMHACLVRPDFNMVTLKPLQSLYDYSPTTGYLL